jgi:hypothetical protein
VTTLKVDARVLHSAGASFDEAADGARQFSENLQTAARWYEKRDRYAAEAITKIEIPE